VLSVKELRVLSSSLKPEAFRKQLGPFVLIQKPERGTAPGETDKMGLPMNVQRTAMVTPQKAQAGALALLFQFEELSVVTLPPLQGTDELSVGRQPDCDLVLDHPSVSKMHAVLKWDASNKRCSVLDQGSTNGTFLNASIRVRKETLLRDGDIISFGEVQYWYLLTETLYLRFRDDLAKAKHRGV
jgi:hypothetical protein